MSGYSIDLDLIDGELKMKKAMNFLVVVSFFCLSSVSYADKYGDFIERKDILDGQQFIKMCKEALKETNEMLCITWESKSTNICGNCFGGNEIVDAFPMYVLRYFELKKIYGEYIKTHNEQETIDFSAIEEFEINVKSSNDNSNSVSESEEDFNWF